MTVKEFATLNVTLYFPLDAHLYAHTQATAALQVIQSLRPDIDVVIIVTADLHNKLGETQVGRVILGTYTSETIQRINFANFDPNNVFDTEVGDIITYTMQACELTNYC